MELYRFIDINNPVYVGEHNCPISFKVFPSTAKSPYKFLYVLASQTESGDMVPYCSTSNEAVANFQAYIRVTDKVEYRVNSTAKRIFQLLEIITSVIPAMVRYGYKPDMTDRRKGTLECEKAFWLKFLCSVFQLSSDIDYGNSLGLEYGNPLNQMSSAFAHSDPFDLSSLDEKEILLSYSGGKESKFIQTIFKELDITFNEATIYDSFQDQRGKDCFGNDMPQYAVQMTHLNCSVSVPFSRLFAGMGDHNSSDFLFSRFVPVVPLQRLLMSLHAYGTYNQLLFGDEAEQQVLYRINYRGENVTYPTHTFFQSQMFYNMLNKLVFKDSDLSLHTPVRNFTQPHIIKYLADRDILIDSCLHLKGAWCGNCIKCINISEQAYLLYGNKFNEIPTFKGMPWKTRVRDSRLSKESLNRLTSVSMFSHSRYDAISLNRGLDNHIDRADIANSLLPLTDTVIVDKVCCTTYFTKDVYQKLIKTTGEEHDGQK